MRTARRRMRQLVNDLGAASRFQAGVAARESGPRHPGDVLRRCCFLTAIPRRSGTTSFARLGAPTVALPIVHPGCRHSFCRGVRLTWEATSIIYGRRATTAVLLAFGSKRRLPVMQWSSLIGAVVGALIGVSATLSSEYTSWRRGRRDTDKAARRKTYAEYLSALSLTRNELRLASRDGSIPVDERSKRAAESFKIGGAYELRYQVVLMASKDVIEASDDAFRALRRIQRVVETGTLHTEKRYIELRDAWDASFDVLTDRMRDDLEAS